MLASYKPTIAMALLSLGSVAGISMDEQLAAQGADLLVGAIGAVVTLAAFLVKLWAGRKPAAAVDSSAGNGGNGNSSGGLMLALLLCLPLLGLAACASSVAQSPAQMVFAMQAEHQAAQKVLMGYVIHPDAKPDLVLLLNELDRTAYASVRAAQAAIMIGDEPKLPALLAAARGALDMLIQRLAVEGILIRPPKDHVGLPGANPAAPSTGPPHHLAFAAAARHPAYRLA